MKLPFVLKRVNDYELSPHYYPQRDIRPAAEFWWGKHALKHMRPHLFARELAKTVQDRAAVESALAKLSPQERVVLNVASRFGSGVSGAVFAAELLARNLTKFRDGQPQANTYQSIPGDAATDLLEKHVLLRSSQDHEFWGYERRPYPDIHIPKLVAASATPPAPVPWPPAGTVSGVSAGATRAPAEVTIDLLKLAQALRMLPGWQVVRGGILSKNTQKKISKFVPLLAATDDPLALPDPWGFYYEMLRSFGFLDSDAQFIREPKLEAYLTSEPEVQAWSRLRAWLDFEHWIDGLGIAGPTNYAIQQGRLVSGKELVIWALCRVAVSPHDWIDLEAFLVEFYRSTRLQSISREFHARAWTPKFDQSRHKNSLPIGEERILAHWLDQEGAWVANAVMVTFAALGLVDRGHHDGQSNRHCFRLTATGRAVFGGPDVNIPSASVQTKFFAVLPNHDILAYLDTADSRFLDLLTRISECTSTSGKVQTFALRRESVYRTLEAGRPLSAIRTFLEEHGRTPLPPTVDRALAEWANKRDSLVVRSDVTVAVDPAGGCGVAVTDMAGRRVGETTTLLAPLKPKDAARQFAGWLVVNHTESERRIWSVSEMGLITAAQIDSISRIRLLQFTEPAEAGWQVTRRSIERALQQRLSAEQILEWLELHLTHPIPPLLKTAIKNWAKPVPVFLGKVHMLQVPNAEACAALLASPTFRALEAEHIPPRWFVIRDEQLPKVKKLLTHLGFAFSDTWLPRSELPSLEKPQQSQAKAVPTHAARRMRPR